MWKDDAIEKHMTKIAQLVIDGITKDYASVEFIGIVLPGTCRVNAFARGKDGKKFAPSNFFDVADELESETLAFHAEFAQHGENWKAVHLVVSADDDFDLQFEYDNPYRWDA